jgi:hypothetical protein
MFVLRTWLCSCETTNNLMEYQLLSRVWNPYLSPLVTNFFFVRASIYHAKFVSLIPFHIFSVIYIVIFCKTTNIYLCCRHTASDVSFSLRCTPVILVFRALNSLLKVTFIERMRNLNFTNCSSLNLSGSALILRFSKSYMTRAHFYILTSYMVNTSF